MPRLKTIRTKKYSETGNQENKMNLSNQYSGAWKIAIRILVAITPIIALSQKHDPSKVWVADNKDGTYKNPVLHADYSDPDAIRVGDDYYLTASSFEHIPGLPILHSRDLVNWSIIGYALKRQPPYEHFSVPRHGDGVWAPSIRYHNKEYYIFYPDPDFGIYVVKAKHPAGPWSDPVLVESGKGLIDPCPLWDNDGKVYLVHAFAGSRAGIKSVIVVKQMSSDARKVIDAGVLVYDGHEKDPTIEGPKFYKRNGYYYIFAPAGGVSTGWQLALRSKNVYGPYERKVVMDQGSSTTNGPHQGAWVSTQTGEDWFLHFQDKEAYGRVLHLQPMKWREDWPVIGEDKDGDGKGQPVLTYRKPNVGKTYLVNTPEESDDFNRAQLGPQWQWMANPKATWSFLDSANGTLRLFSDKMPDSAKNLWDVPNVLVQKFPAEEFVATTRISFTPNPKVENEQVGFAIMGLSYAGLSLRSKKDGIHLVHFLCQDAGIGKAEKETILSKVTGKTIFFRVKVSARAKCQFSFSEDGNAFTDAGSVFTAQVGKWVGARLALFCTRTSQTNDAGYADVDWFLVEKSR
jgi:beta-xylosidase